MKKSVVKYISLCALSLATGFFYSLSNVYADEYTFIDVNYINAYNTFLKIGFKQPDLASSININLTDTITGTIQQDGSFSLSLSNLKLTETGDLTTTGRMSQNGVGLEGTVGSTSRQLNCAPNPLNSSTSSGTFANPRYSCTYGPNYSTTNLGTQQPISITKVNIGYSETTSGTRISTFSGSIGSDTSLKFNVNENGSINGTMSSNIIYSSHYLIPDSSKFGTYTRYYSYNSNSEDQYIQGDLDFYIVADLKGTFSGNNSSNTHPKTMFQNGTSNFAMINFNYFDVMSGYDATGEYINDVCFWRRNVNSVGRSFYVGVNPNFVFPSDFEIIPLYVGFGRYMPTNIRELIGLSSREFILSQHGDNNSQASSEGAADANDDLISGFNQLDTFEKGFNNDLTSGFQAIDTNTNITTDGNFINSALWISQQFTRIVSYPAINLSLVFCLVLGLAMTLIGKLRG